VEEHVAGEVWNRLIEQSEGPDQLRPRVVPGEHVVGRADDEGGSRVKPLDEGPHGGRHLAVQRAGRRTQLGVLTHHRQHRELPAFVVVEAEGVGQGRNHAGRRTGVTSLFQADEVVDADPGDFLPAQTGRSPAVVVG
jgi:hypothetical protein